MRTSLLLLTIAIMATSTRAAPTKSNLLNGRDLAGWELVTLPATPAAIAEVYRYGAEDVLTVSGQPMSYLATTASYENYTLHAEWRWPGKPGNSGILLHIASAPKDGAWPLCIQMQLKNKSAGDVLPMAGATIAEPLAAGIKTPTYSRTSPDSEKAPGEWNACDVICRGDTIEIMINGIAQTRVTKCRPAAGKIGFQLEGVSFELRNLRIGPLPLAIGAGLQTDPRSAPPAKF